jgi:hypothetical protein
LDRGEASLPNLDFFFEGLPGTFVNAEEAVAMAEDLIETGNVMLSIGDSIHHLSL